MHRRADGQFQIDWSGWKAEVKFGRDEARVAISDGSCVGSGSLAVATEVIGGSWR